MKYLLHPGRDLFRHQPDQCKNFWDIPDFAGTFFGFLNFDRKIFWIFNFRAKNFWAGQLSTGIFLGFSTFEPKKIPGKSDPVRSRYCRFTTGS
jgi:hypothetical protein